MALDDMTQAGYSREEEYFYKRNKELIEKRRRDLDAQRKAEADKPHGEHWMRCPKCGQQMEEANLGSIVVEQCSGCKGVFFDHGELKILMDSQEPAGFLSGLKRLFG